MTQTTDQLIEQLTAQAAPVRRLRPPLLRAALWLGGVSAVAALAVVWFADLADVGQRLRDDPWLGLEMATALTTGVCAVIAALHLSYPDRPARWALLPLPPLVLWIAGSGYACYRNWIVSGTEGWEWGESAACFQFIVGTSLPLAISLVALLRRARPLNPELVAAVGGLGVAAVSAFLLNFFHPFDITFMDLAVHAVAVGIVVLVTALSDRLSPADRRHL